MTSRALLRLLAPVATALCLQTVLPLPGAALAAENGRYRLDLRPEESQITLRVDATLHKVRGSAAITRGELIVDTAREEIRGRIVIDATSAETGNRRRDRQMHRKVLRSDAHPEIVLVPTTYRGVFDPQGVSHLEIQGRFILLGVEHAIEIPVTVSVVGSRLHIAGDFVVPYVEWGLQNPSSVFLRVAKQVDVHLDLSADFEAIG